MVDINPNLLVAGGDWEILRFSEKRVIKNAVCPRSTSQNISSTSAQIFRTAVSKPGHHIHGAAVKGVGHRGHVEAMEAGGREFVPRPGRYSRMSF